MSLVLSHRIEGLAATVGRIRKRHPDDYALDDLAADVEILDAITFPTAAELYASFHDTEDEDDAVQRALSITDARAHRIRGLLGIRDPLATAA